MIRLVLWVLAGDGWVVWGSWPLADDHAKQVHDQAVALIPAAVSGRMRYELLPAGVAQVPAPPLAGVVS